MTAQGDDRAQIIEQFVSIVAERGYVQTKVSELTARAGVTRAHFYELFKDKEDCFLQAQRELAATLVDEAARAIAAADPRAAARTALAALCEFAEQKPAAFTFLTHEATLAGSSAWCGRQAMIEAVRGEIEEGWAGLSANTRVSDLEGHLLGGAIRAIGIRMRRGEDRPTGLLDELHLWIESYAAPRGTRRWSSVIASAHPVRAGEAVVLGPIEPAPLPRGRHRLPPAIAKQTQRERLLHATGRVMTADGYAKATVAEIVEAAGVSREVFYEHFHDKQEAFAETIKFVFEQIIARTAGAYFSTDGPWTERVWQASAAATGFLAAQPSLVQAVFVEPYAVAAEVQRPDEFIVGFTLFLEGGYSYRPQAADVPRIAAEAIGGAVLESINVYLRSGRAAELAQLTPGIAYLLLAPFMGADAAYEFVVAKGRERG